MTTIHPYCIDSTANIIILLDPSPVQKGKLQQQLSLNPFIASAKSRRYRLQDLHHDDDRPRRDARRDERGLLRAQVHEQLRQRRRAKGASHLQVGIRPHEAAAQDDLAWGDARDERRELCPGQLHVPEHRGVRHADHARKPELLGSVP